MASGTIFISYRRADSAVIASILGQTLKERLGSERVFLDTEDLAPGASFADGLRRAVEGCDVMLVLIGPQWVTTDGEGRSIGPGGLVREEIVAALAMEKRVVPVMIDDAPVPSMADLPPDLYPLLYRQFLELRRAHLNEDLARLLSVLDAVFAGLSFDLEKSADFIPTNPASTRSFPILHEASVTALAHRVFISHSSEDRPLVDEVLRALESAGLWCWVSYRDLADGEPSWAGAIVGAIANSALMVVVVSKYAIGSRQVLREVTIADSENIPFLPYCIDATPLSNDFKYFFSAGQRLDAADLARGDALTRLVAAVRSRAGLGGSGQVA